MSANPNMSAGMLPSAQVPSLSSNYQSFTRSYPNPTMLSIPYHFLPIKSVFVYRSTLGALKPQAYIPDEHAKFISISSQKYTQI